MVLGRFFLGVVLCVVVASDDDVRPTFSIYQTAEWIKSDGFEPETHHVTTTDGYILEMHRIPYGRNVQDTSDYRPVVFVMHGLMSSSQSFILISPDHGFAYNLADAGFDVWMGNARGNKNSRFHVFLDPDDEEEKFQFFDFSFEEIGMYDLPAMIDYVLQYTKRDKLHYIGHSQGGTVFLVMASMLPEYNEKLISTHLLAGVGYQDYFPDTELRLTAIMTDIIYAQALRSGIVELFPPNSVEMIPGISPSQELSDARCVGSVEYSYLCELFGVRSILRNNPNDQAGAALKQIAHYGQNIRDREFRRYHHGRRTNQEVYNDTSPPVYDLGLITSPVTMHYSLSDDLLDERDVLAMVADMPNAIARKVARDSFLHSDYVAALDAKELVTDYIIEEIIKADLAARPVEETTVTAAPVTDNTTPVTENTTPFTENTTPVADAAATIVLNAITSPVTMHYSLSDELLDERDVLAMVAEMPNAIARKIARDSFLHSDYVAALDAKELVTDYIIEEIIKADLAARPPEETTATPSPVTDNTTPVNDAAATIVLNVNLLVLNLYIMFK
uniref:Partial AB-hydrolase lipase domain-containing protein n=1 Tax=Heliothis virescens TaxID=7102 RepID=A0A2A4K1T1_HELVI